MRRWRLSLMSTWGFFLYAWTSVGPRGVAAQSSNSSSSSSYPECSGYAPYMNDSVCDELNNNAECGYDGGDCCFCTCVDSPTNSCGYDFGFNCTDPNVPDDCGQTPSPAAAFGFPNCSGYIWDLGNEFCDDDLNNEECGYDGGDCCRCTCRNTDYYNYCGYYGYDCLDPDAPTDCESVSPTPSPAAALGYPDCTGDMTDLQNGNCDWDLNNEECGYDGGDCCRCTCEDGLYYTCGYNGYNCLDSNADTDCPTPSPTPSPAAGLGYPDCTGYMYDLHNGFCDSDLNNEECGYDGGDCCSCTCEEGLYYTCGYYGYSCLDPTADSYCPTPSPTPTPAAGLGYPDCTGDMSDLQNGYCDADLNNEECGYDGGDCCSCTCEDGAYQCGAYGFDCEDPAASSYCPRTGFSYPKCTGDMSDLQDGYCDWDLNNEDCGYDGGDCCECSCTGNNGKYDCGEYGYNCLDPDPCPSVEKSSEDAISLTAVIIIIACVVVIGPGCFVFGRIKMKRRVQMGARGSTAQTASSSPPPAYLTTLHAQQYGPNRTTSNPAGRQPTIAQSVGPVSALDHVYVVNPQSAAAQSDQQPRVHQGHSYAVTGSRADQQPSAPTAPPQPDTTDSGTPEVDSARVATFRSAPLPESSALEQSANAVAVGRRPNADAIETERFRFALAESRSVQTISEAIVRNVTFLPQCDASTAVVTGTGSSPSDIANGGNIEDYVPSNADENDDDQGASSGSEWGSDGENGMEEEGSQDGKKNGAEGDQQPGKGHVGGDDGGHKGIVGPIRTEKGGPPDVTNGGNVEEKAPGNADEKDIDQDEGSGNEWGGDEEGGTEEEGPQGNDELGAGVDQQTGTEEIGGDVDEQEEIMGSLGPTQEKEEQDDDNSSYSGVQAESSNNESRVEMTSGDTHQAEILAVSSANLAEENSQAPGNFKKNDVDPDPSISSE